MQRGAIAFVLRKSVGGIARLHFDHEAVARDLRDDARGGDAEAEPVAADERGLRHGEGEHGQAVDQGVIGCEDQRGESAAHRFVRGVEDVQPVDFLGLDHSESPADFAVAGDLGVKPFAGSLGKFFRVVEIAMAESLREHDRRRDHRAGERAAPRLINSGDAHPTLPTQGAFVFEAATHRRR